MFQRIESRIIAAAICTFVVFSIAAAHEVRITDLAKVGSGSELQPGTYRVEVVKSQDSSEAHFYKGRDLWLRAPAPLAPEKTKASNTEVHYSELNGGKVITQIRLKGSKESLVFNQALSAKAE